MQKTAVYYREDRYADACECRCRHFRQWEQTAEGFGQQKNEEEIYKYLYEKRDVKEGVVCFINEYCFDYSFSSFGAGSPHIAVGSFINWDF